MILFVVRHAKAFERSDAQWPDDSLRPLTKGGMRRFAALASASIAAFDAPELVVASSYRRAWQTAEILEEEANWPKASRAQWLECDAETPIESAREFLASRKELSVALVGHEPILSELVSELMGCHGPGVTMGKGAMAVLEVRDPEALLEVESFPGSAAELLALITPRWFD